MTPSMLFAVLSFTTPSFGDDSPNGLWEATAVIKGVEIPFRLEVAGAPSVVEGRFFNGDRKVVSTSGRFEKGSLTLHFEHYLMKLEAVLKDDRLEGALHGSFAPGGIPCPFRAVRRAATVDSAKAPLIDGVWEIPHMSRNSEKAWRLVVRQTGAEVSAAILRLDGDTGELYGTYRGDKFVLGHFSAARPMRLEIKPTRDGGLELLQNGKLNLIALRPAAARAKGLPEPTDPTKHTTVKDPSEPFRFRFPDVEGRIVSNADPRFQGKVVIAVVTGTWCPNCHDEAPLLVELYRKYRKQGLEVVALDFEEGEQQRERTRLRAFIKKYGVEYTYLVAGTPSEMQSKLPAAVNLNAWPTTFFIGRDGRVRAVHAGFAGSATGDFHRRLREEFTAQIERLLGEGAAAKSQIDAQSRRRNHRPSRLPQSAP